MGNTTKRILAVLLSAALLLTAAGCGKDKAAADGEDPDGELTIDQIRLIADLRTITSRLNR